VATRPPEILANLPRSNPNIIVINLGDYLYIPLNSVAAPPQKKNGSDALERAVMNVVGFLNSHPSANARALGLRYSTCPIAYSVTVISMMNKEIR
jgi:hypothetical protein